MQKKKTILKAIKKVLANCIEIKYDFTEYSHGEHYFTAYAHSEGKLVGYLDGGIYNDIIAVKYIHVNPEARGKGIGGKLILSLVKKFPECKIDMGMMTGDGKKLWESVKDEIPLKNIYDPKPERFSKDIINKIKHKNKEVGSFLEDVYTTGSEKAWEKLFKLGFSINESDIDYNDIDRLAEYIEGSKEEQPARENEIPEYVWEIAESFGIKR